MIDPELQPHELARYSRHILLPEVGVAGQEKLKAARVLVVGAGGLGSPAALYLAAAGVGTLGLADFDKVEEHNLQRQILHTTDAVGSAKVESARTRLLQLNPHLRIDIHPAGIQPDNAATIFGAYDVIVDGSDNFQTRYLNNDAAFFARKPLVYGSIFRFEGQASVFDPSAGGPCYRCLFPKPPAPGSVPNCGEAGVFGALCGVIGSIQAMEAIKTIVTAGEPLLGKLLVIDSLTMCFRRISIKRDPDCPLCGRHPRIRKIEAREYEVSCEAPPAASSSTGTEAWPLEIDVHDAHRLLSSGEALVIDVREPFEVGICRIPGSVTIPMGEVPGELDRLPRGRHLLIQCHHGGRSMQVTQFLRQQGFTKVSNVAGGIDAWAQEIDPSLQRY